MERLTGLCAELGGAVLVHGSPKQRAIAPGDTPGVALGRLAEALERIAHVAGRHGVVYCIEPLGRTETALVNTVAEAAELVATIDHPGLRTMIDCSAAGATESVSVPELIDRWLPTGLIAHIQVNDPTRRAPGQGEMRFAPILAALDATTTAGSSASSLSTTCPTGPGRRPGPSPICAGRAKRTPRSDPEPSLQGRLPTNARTHPAWPPNDSASSCTASPDAWA